MLSLENAEIAKVTCEPCVVLAVLYFLIRNPTIENIEYRTEHRIIIIN